MVIGDDAPERLAALPERHGLEGVTFLHDPGGEVAARYGAMRTPEPASTHGGHTEPAVLVLRPDRTVAQASYTCLLYTSPSPRDGLLSRMPSSA